MEEIKKRLMPEGMEWPRFEDGELVKIGDFIASPKSRERREVDCIYFFDDAWYFGLVGASSERLDRRERVKRPPILTADGEPLEVGQTVWHTKTGTEYQVLSLPDGEKGAWLKNGGGNYFLDYAVLTHQRPVLDSAGVEIRVGDVLYSVETGDYVTVDSIEPGNPWFATTDGALQHCSKFIHRAPVFAADGKPLREGETVWGVTGASYRITGAHDGGVFARHVNGSFGAEVKTAGGEGLYQLRADKLTHERPDSWERLEEDADALLKAESNGKGSYNAANDYCNAHGLGTDGTVWVLVAQDLVRRAKKLAGVSE